MNFYKDLIKKTNNFISPSLNDNLAELDLTAVYDAPVKALKEMSKSVQVQDPTYKNSLRIYVNGEAREDMEEYILQNPPQSFSVLEEWGKDTFGDADYLIILNRVEKWHDPIVKWCGELFLSAEGKIHEDLLHLEVTYFIGNTTYTPFGVHIDDISDALHLNLGPNKRYMHLWSPELYKKMRGSLKPLINPNNQFLAKSQRFQINPNNWFYLPASRYFHIGENTDFSVSLAIALIRFDSETIIKRSLQEDIVKIQSINDQDINELINNVLEEVVQREDGLISYEKVSTCKDNKLEEEVIKYILRIQSNLGFRVPTKMTLLKMDQSRWNESTISIVKPFKILTLVKDDVMHIFARGNIVSLTNHSILSELIKYLNSESSIEFQELKMKYSQHLSEDSLNTLIQTFYKCGILEVKSLVH
ncbi:hypothetical protein BC6307_21060 [Sutcliffiella cohnii]|uniref:JmjC domain-containing protein n=1 Tax=Sutcliffiella cohnii TaxID=33932 RepID=A0A223KW68_9BACI|nr:hypothetical protein [Sutcliffiella cohnii]AST93578.1 hypothetical protein BC6307_21060 [Sutcliffiella cohnii]